MVGVSGNLARGYLVQVFSHLKRSTPVLRTVPEENQIGNYLICMCSSRALGYRAVQ